MVVLVALVMVMVKGGCRSDSLVMVVMTVTV